MRLKNSTALITGGTSGLGLEFAKQLIEQGADVILTGRNLETLNETKRRIPEVHIFQSDVSRPEDIEQLFLNVTKKFPNLNIIINNAGEMRLMDLQDGTLDIKDITREIAINLSGTILMVQQFLPHLLKKESSAIVNVSSAIAFMPYSVAPIYSASKAGVRAYTQALRLQLQETSVSVFEMIPPGVKTNLQSQWSIQPNPAMMMEPEKMVRVAIEGLIKNKPELKPAIVTVIRSASRLVPGLLLKFGHREFKKFKGTRK